MPSTLTRRLASAFVLMLAATTVDAIEDPGANPLAPPLFQSESLQVSELGAPADALPGVAVRERVQQTGSRLDSAVIDLPDGKSMRSALTPFSEPSSNRNSDSPDATSSNAFANSAQ